MSTKTARRGPTATVLATEARLLTRSPIGLLWGFAVPSLAFVILGCIPALRSARSVLAGASFLQVYEPVLVVLGASMLALAGMPQVVASYRELGILRRLFVTPLPPSRLLGAQVVVNAAVAMMTAVVVLVVGEAAFDVGPGREVGGWALAYVLTVAAMLGLGLVIASVAPNASWAGAIGTVLFFPLMFGAGLWIPLARMPDVLRHLCDWTPLGAATRAMAEATSGSFPTWTALVALAAYAVVFWLLAIRFFRWG